MKKARFINVLVLFASQGHKTRWSSTLHISDPTIFKEVAAGRSRPLTSHQMYFVSAGDSKTAPGLLYDATTWIVSDMIHTFSSHLTQTPLLFFFFFFFGCLDALQHFIYLAGRVSDNIICKVSYLSNKRAPCIYSVIKNLCQMQRRHLNYPRSTELRLSLAPIGALQRVEACPFSE